MSYILKSQQQKYQNNLYMGYVLRQWLWNSDFVETLSKFDTFRFFTQKAWNNWVKNLHFHSTKNEVFH